MRLNLFGLLSVIGDYKNRCNRGGGSLFSDVSCQDLTLKVLKVCPWDEIKCGFREGRETGGNGSLFSIQETIETKQTRETRSTISTLQTESDK